MMVLVKQVGPLVVGQMSMSLPLQNVTKAKGMFLGMWYTLVHFLLVFVSFRHMGYELIQGPPAIMHY